MIEKDDSELSISRQCEMLGVNRSTFYYKPVEPDPYDLELMALIDQQYLKTPFYGSRKMTVWLKSLGHDVGRTRVQRLIASLPVGPLTVYRSIRAHLGLVYA